MAREKHRQLGLAIEDGHAPIILCDRGSLDALAYWPHDHASFFAQLGTTAEQERARYTTIIHLRTPSFAQGYNLRNPVRIETPEQAAELDRRIEQAWAGHPHRHFIDGQDDFLLKLTESLRLLREEIAGHCVLGAAPAAR